LLLHVVLKCLSNIFVIGAEIPMVAVEGKRQKEEDDQEEIRMNVIK
jgi:hypothetical protein